LKIIYVLKNSFIQVSIVKLKKLFFDKYKKLKHILDLIILD